MPPNADWALAHVLQYQLPKLERAVRDAYACGPRDKECDIRLAKNAAQELTDTLQEAKGLPKL